MDWLGRMKNAPTIIEDLSGGPTNLALQYPNAYVPVVPNGKICPITGLRHAKLYHLLQHGAASHHVRTVSLKEPGANRGKLLFHTGDMLRWLDSLARVRRQESAPCDSEFNTTPAGDRAA
jgi:hypothetical protein